MISDREVRLRERIDKLADERDRLEIREGILVEERTFLRRQNGQQRRRIDALTAERDLLRQYLAEARKERALADRAAEGAQIARRVMETENARLRRALGRKAKAS